MAVPNTANATPGASVNTAPYYDAIVMVQNTVYPAGKAIMNAAAAAATTAVFDTVGGNSISFANIPIGAIVPISVTRMTSATATIILLY